MDSCGLSWTTSTICSPAPAWPGAPSTVAACPPTQGSPGPSVFAFSIAISSAGDRLPRDLQVDLVDASRPRAIVERMNYPP
jgi:hypothetical protein